MNRLHGQRPCDRAIGTGPVRANPAATHRLRHLEPVRPPVSPIFAARRRQERSETADAITCIYPAPPPGAEQRRPAPQRPRPAGHTPAVPDPICSCSCIITSTTCSTAARRTSHERNWPPPRADYRHLLLGEISAAKVTPRQR